MKPMIRKKNANRSLLNEMANLARVTYGILMSNLTELLRVHALLAPNNDLAQTCERSESLHSRTNRWLWLNYSHLTSLGTFIAKHGKIKELMLPASTWIQLTLCSNFAPSPPFPRNPLRTPPLPSLSQYAGWALVLIKIPDWHSVPSCSLKLVSYSALITPLKHAFYRRGPLLCLRLIK